MKNKPAYGIESVDHALHLAQILQQEGPLRVSDAATRLGVARSTAHRLLAMLVYRDFAEQDEDKRYLPGPVLRRALSPEPASTLRSIALPHLTDLVDRLDETVNLQIRVGDHVRFVATVECDQVLRVGDREGKVLPAHLASGGLALLATLTDREVEALYAESSDADLPRLLKELRRIRQRGYAVNNQRTEAGVTAIGQVMRLPDGRAVAAVSIAIPSTRFSRERLPQWTRALSATATRIEQDLVALAS